MDKDKLTRIAHRMGWNLDAMQRWNDALTNRAANESDGDILFLNGPVVSDMIAADFEKYDGENFPVVNPAYVNERLAQIEGDISVQVNSPGGSVFAGYEIYNALRMATEKRAVNVLVTGVAASAAGFIAVGGTRLDMSEASMFMIHPASGLTIGNAKAHADMQALLEKMDGEIIDIFSRKTGKPKDAIAKLMNQNTDTWFTAQEAVDAGIADGIRSPEGDDTPPEGNEASELAMLERILDV